MIKEQSNALSKDGESPANHTKNITPRNLKIKLNFFPKSFLPEPDAMAAKKERCMPLKARI